MNRSACVFLSMLVIGAPTLVKAQSSPRPPAGVPFVGCAADGQAGPESAPKGDSRPLPIPAEIAQELAYYKSFEGVGVLAPRGWYCFEVYGSNGGELYVGPQRITPDDFFAGKWNGFDGPGIELAGEVAGTSGRFEVARTIARVFPTHKAFVDAVIDEALGQASDFPFGPYAKDKLTYRSNELVEYETPANTDGLGTDSRLKKNASPISGMAMLVGEELDLVQLAVRLPANQTDLAPVIIQQAERDAMQSAASQ